MSKKAASAEREGLRVGKVASSGLSLSKPEYVVRQHPQIFDADQTTSSFDEKN